MKRMKTLFYNGMKIFTFVFLLLFLNSCKQSIEPKATNTFAPKIEVAKGIEISIKKFSLPEIKIAEKPKLKRVGKPTITITNKNIITAGKPVINIYCTDAKFCRDARPCVSVLGVSGQTVKDARPCVSTNSTGDARPCVSTNTPTPIVAGIPQISFAKDAHNKDQNSQNFSSYGKQQGLRLNRIKCLLQDKIGNIWLGTDGAGVTKYDGTYFTHFTINEGLSNNTIKSIYQDSEDNLWFGTDGGGVSKYDGKTFVNYTTNNGLCNNTVNTIVQDANKTMWFGTDSGVCKFDGKQFFQFSKFDELKNCKINVVILDKHSNFWIGTQGKGVVKFDGKNLVQYTENNGLPSNNILSILEDRSGSMWFGTDGFGVSQMTVNTDLGNETIIFQNYTETQGLCNNTIFYIEQDFSRNIWFATNGGVSKYDGKTFTNFTEKEGLCNNTVWSILQGHSGIIWFGTFGGFGKYSGKIFTHFTENEGLSNNYVSAILKDKNGDLWIGFDGGGVSKYDENAFLNFSEKEGLCSNNITSILQDNKNNIWFSSINNGVTMFDGNGFENYTTANGLCSNMITCMLRDKNNNIWFGSKNSGITKLEKVEINNVIDHFVTQYTKNEGLCSNKINCMMQDNVGNLWFGTDGDGVSKLTIRNLNGLLENKFVHFTVNEGLSNNYINTIFEDKIGNIWFGTNGGGVSKYDGKRFTHFTEKEGLTNNNVLSIMQDKRGDIWFGTRFGISKFRIRNINLITQEPVFSLFKNYTYEDGFLGTGCNRNAICEDNTGAIWIGANDRLTVFHPEGAVTDIIPPNIQIMGIELFNENIPWTSLEKNNDTEIMLTNGLKVGNFKFRGTSKWYGLPNELSLAYNNNYLSFIYIGITQKQSEKVQYQYKLEGLEKKWTAITNRSSATYGNLLPGKYTFMVKAYSSEGYWSKTKSYSFTIRPPFWVTWWFRTSILIIVVFLIYSFISWRERKLKNDKFILEKKVDEQTFELSEQNEELNLQNEQIQNNLASIKTSQAQIVMSGKMAALGQLIAGVAHEVNTPLGAIKSSIGNISETLDSTLKNIPHIFQNLTPTEIDIFFRLLEISLQKKLNITSKEERLFRKEMSIYLAKQNVAKSDRIADTFTDMGIYSIDDSCIPLIQKENAVEIVQIAYELSGIMRSSQTIQIAVDKATKVVFALKSYTHFNQNDEPTVANIEDGIETVLTIYQNLLKQGVEVVKNYADIPKINCYPDELNQVWTNIIHNAIHAMNSKGTLSIKTEFLPNSYLKSGDNGLISISITDTGCGIPAEIKDKIFEPFFTTKPQGEGSGLGLDIVKKIVDKHKGKITIESAPGNTTVYVYLPVRVG